MTRNDYLTVALDASTGSTLWAKPYASQGDGADNATSVATSPDGSAVYVTGYGSDPVTDDDYATIAYDASAGGELWVNRYTAPESFAYSIAVSPDGSKVFATGRSNGDYITVAYAA